MQCNICPLFSSWNNESDSGEACALFGDGWDSQFMYERNNQIWGCYIEKAYIKKVEQRIEKHRAEEVKAFLESEDKGMTDELKQWEYDRGYEKGKADVLDKIRAEIKRPLEIERYADTESAKAQAIALSWCIEIIDKYRKEQE